MTTPALLIPRERILAATVDIIVRDGADAATTRAVAEAAGVQAPAIYRLFGDKDGLLEAATEYAMARYVAGKSAAKPAADAVEALRQGWDAHLGFALEHREIYRMVIGLETMGGSAASQKGVAVLRAKIEAVAAAGRLRLPVEQALDLFHAMASGAIVRLLGQAGDADRTLWCNAREAALAAILADQPARQDGVSTIAAISLRAALPDHDGLTPGERLLMGELLDRIVAVQ
ncbi:MAG: TetR/AcrR family transcriptional regulator [Devosia sp.]